MKDLFRALNLTRAEEFGANYDKAFAQKYALDVDDRQKVSPYLYNSLMPFPKPYFDVVKYAGSVAMIPGFIDGNLASYSLDEIYRNHEYLTKYKGSIYPSLAMRTFLLAKDNPKMVLTDSRIKFPDLKYGFNIRKTDYQLIAPVKFYKLYDNGYSHKKFSAVDIIDSYNNIKSGKKSVIDPEIFKDKIVLVGTNVPISTGLNDNKNTPVSVNHPGVDYQADCD